jgi:endonuclease YncB( thermonuclease family)
VANMGPYPALILDWHDGDTCHPDLDLGFDEILAAYDLDGKPRLSCRVYGINAPELKDKPAGPAAHDYAQQICPPGTRVTIMSHGWDKFGGRFDGTITLPDGSDFAQRMVEAGQAVSYLV